MKLLFDQNLSPALVHRLTDLYPDSAHVQALGFGSASDTAIWTFAIQNGFAIVTQDSDFSDRSALEGHPPKIIWLRLGNSTTSEIAEVLRAHVVTIREFDTHPETGVLALF